MKKSTRLLSMIMALCVALSGLLIFAPAEVNAEGAPMSKKYAKKITVTTDDFAFRVNMKKQLKGAKAIKVTSSKPSVLKVTAKGGKKGPILQVGKKGTSKITVTYKKGGKTKKLTTTIKVVKYTNPFKSYKIAGVEVAKKFNKTAYTTKTIGEKTGTISIIPKKGWTVKKIVDDRYSIDSSGKEHEKVSKIANNSAVTLSYDDSNRYFRITMVNKKKNLTQEFQIAVW